MDTGYDRKEYLKMAEGARELARKANDTLIMSEWLRIAERYEDLARKSADAPHR